MTIKLNDIKRGVDIPPPRLLLYGIEGVGKTTFAANSPRPILFQTGEAGEGILNVPRFSPDILGSFNDIIAALDLVYQKGDEFETIAIDTVDALERIIWMQVAEDYGKDSIDEISYGRGYKTARTYWREFLEGLDAIRGTGKSIILIGHADILSFTPPDGDSYDRYDIKLDPKINRWLNEWADIVGFANFDLRQIKAKEGFKDRIKVATTGRRILNLTHKAAHLAKNRYGMKDKIEFSWGAFETEWKNAITRAESGKTEDKKQTKTGGK